MSKLKTKILYDEIFEFGWLLGVGGTESDMGELAFKKYNLELKYREPAQGFFTFHPHNLKQCLIWVKTKSNSLIIHECIHAANYVCDYLKAELSANSEVNTYYAEWLFNNIKAIK